MFHNSIKELGEPCLDNVGATFQPRRDSLSRLHDALKIAALDGHVRYQVENANKKRHFG